MKISIRTSIFSTVLILFVVFSCSKDEDELVKEGGPFNISELAGNWEATSGFFGSDIDSLSVDIVAEGGSLSLSVQSSGIFTLTIDPHDRDAYTESGEMFWEAYEGDYYFAIQWDNFPDDWSTYGATHTGSTFSMYGASDAGEYDFDNDGTSEPARLGFEFIKI